MHVLWVVERICDYGIGILWQVWLYRNQTLSRFITMPARASKVVNHIEVGCLIGLEFLDHVEDLDVPIKCTAFGRLVKVDPVYYVIASWESGEEVSLNDPNNKLFTILRSTITNTNLLLPVPV